MAHSCQSGCRLRGAENMAHSCQSALKYHVKFAKGLAPPGCYSSFWQAIKLVLHPRSSAFWHNSSLQTVCIVEVGHCAATPYHDISLEPQHKHERLTQMLQSEGCTVHVLPVLLGSIGEIFMSPLANIKLAVVAR